MSATWPSGGMRRTIRFGTGIVSKFKNVRTITEDGIKHPSAKQAKRWDALRILEKAGRIRNLKREQTFKLDIGGIKVCDYRADHVYEEYTHTLDGPKWVSVVEDVKGFRTDIYRLKRKLMQAVHGITIREV